MRLIDADVLMSRIENSARNAGLHSEDYRKIKRFIATTHTIDAEPVRHGRWVYDEEGHTCCSECYERLPYIHCYSEEPCSEYDEEWDEEVPKSLYCPNCGAKMDAKDIDVPTKPETHRPEDCVNYATRQRDGRAVCLGTRELDPCDGAGCKRWKGKVKDE